MENYSFMKQHINMKQKVGICFGGYCPLHQGPMDVIMKAKKENDVCFLIVCGYENEPRSLEINLSLEERTNLIKKVFIGDEQIIVLPINDTELGIDESMSDNNWKIWQEKVAELCFDKKRKVYSIYSCFERFIHS